MDFFFRLRQCRVGSVIAVVVCQRYMIRRGSKQAGNACFSFAQRKRITLSAFANKLLAGFLASIAFQLMRALQDANNSERNEQAISWLL